MAGRRGAAAAEPLPNVPTLIFSGGQDLRTPTANARGRRAHPRRAGRARPLHRPLGARQRPQRLRGQGDRGFFAGARYRRAPSARVARHADAAAQPLRCGSAPPGRPPRADARRGARHARRPDPPGHRRDPADRARSRRLALRRPARRLRQPARWSFTPTALYPACVSGRVRSSGRRRDGPYPGRKRRRPAAHRVPGSGVLGTPRGRRFTLRSPGPPRRRGRTAAVGSRRGCRAPPLPMTHPPRLR